MSGFLLPVPIFQWFDDLGLPLANGLVYVYAAGGTTPATSYKDLAGTSPNSNPIQLDAFGKAVIYFLAGNYKLDVQTALGVSLDGYPRDGVQVGAVGGTAGAPGYPFAGDSDTGLFSTGPNTLGLSVGGIDAFDINSQGFQSSAIQPRCQVFHNTTQALANGAITAVLFNSEDYDVGGLHDTGVNTSRLTIPTGGDGFYLFVATISLAAPGGNSLSVSWKKNGGTVVSTATIVSAPAMGGNPAQVQTIALLPVVATDYLEVFAVQDSGGALNAGSATRLNSNQACAVKLW